MDRIYEDRFKYHPANTDQKREAHTDVRAGARRLTEFIIANVPAGRERDLSIERVEEAMFWANAAVARAR